MPLEILLFVLSMIVQTFLVFTYVLLKLRRTNMHHAMLFSLIVSAVSNAVLYYYLSPLFV
mgnify:CR=1 FL=1